jgi:hypothetical protein
MDDVVDEEVGVVKIDVEGHELDVLRGASGLLEEQRLRDILFEEFEPYPSPVTRFLEPLGYSVFKLVQGLLGLTVTSATKEPGSRSWYPPSYLATTQPDRALARLHKKGWAVFGIPGIRARQRSTP